MRLPWIPIITAIIAGILVTEMVEVPWQLSALGIAMLILLAILPVILGLNRVAFSIILCSFFCLGIVLYEFQSQRDDILSITNQIALGKLDPERIAEFTGTIDQHPDRRSERVIVKLSLEQVRQDKTVWSTHGNLRLTIYLEKRWQRQMLPFQYGDRIRFFAQLKKPYRSLTPGTFDFANYLRLQGIDYLCHVKSPLAVEILNRGNGLPFISTMSAIKNQLSNSVLKHFSDSRGMDQRGALLSAMVLGDRGFVREEALMPLKRAGLMHIIAISGYHVWVVGLIVYGLLSFMHVPVTWVHGATSAFLIIYWAIAGARSSVSRACIVALVFLISKMLYKRIHPLNNLGFAAFLIILINPFAPLDAGFQMTFAAAASIIILYPFLSKLLIRAKWLGPPLTIAIAAQLGVIPIVAWHFNTVNIHAAFTGLIALPIVSLGIFSGFLYFLGFQFIPFVSDLLIGFIAFNFGVLLELLSFFDDVLPLTIRMPKPPVFLIIAHFAVIIGWTMYHHFRRQTALIPGDENPKLVSLIPFLLMVFLFALNPFVAPFKGSWNLHKLDVGQSSATVLEHPDGGVVLIDAGGSPMSDFDVGENVVSPFLWHRGHRRIDVAVATHSDRDHLEGFTAILRNFSVGELWLPLSARRSELLSEIELLAEQHGIPIRHFRRGETAEWRDTRWQFLNPPVPSYRGRNASNNNSLIGRIAFGQWSYFFTGDAERRALDEVADLYDSKIQSTIKEAPHHGSVDALSEAFIDCVDPEVVVISAGKDNSFGFPHLKVLEVLAERQIPIFRTDRDGTISFSFSDSGISISCFAEAELKTSSLYKEIRLRPE